MPSLILYGDGDGDDDDGDDDDDDDDADDALLAPHHALLDSRPWPHAIAIMV